MDFPPCMVSMGMTRGKSGSGAAGAWGSGVAGSELRPPGWPLGFLELPTVPMGPKAEATPRRPRARMLLLIIILL